jgi:ABC-2 type transport system ATP-binding protein
MSKYAFETKNVKKYYNGDKVKALDGVTLKAEHGKVLALLGPNGAGKTTIVRMLSTLLAPTSGTVKVMGMDVVAEAHDVREIIGLAGQYAAVDEFLTGRENIQMSGRLYHLPKAEVKKRTETILARLNLTEAADRQVKTYSGGMRRRLDLGASLVGNPKILFLDEPTTGLDPRTRQELWHIIQDLVDEGTTVLLTTQYMDEADQLADHIAVIDRGKLIAEGTSDELKTHLGGDVVEFALDKESDVKEALKAVAKLSKQKPTVDEDGLTITVPVKNGSKGLLNVVEELNKVKISPASLSLHRPSLDDVFLALTGKKAVSAIKPEEKKKGRK